MTVQRTPNFEGLPPLMGFPQEALEDHKFCVSFYTCVIGPFRIFVYCESGEGPWRLERKVNDPNKLAKDQFFGPGAEPYEGDSWGLDETRDPITLMACIQQVTSESNKEALTEEA